MLVFFFIAVVGVQCPHPIASYEMASLIALQTRTFADLAGLEMTSQPAICTQRACMCVEQIGGVAASCLQLRYNDTRTKVKCWSLVP